MKILLLEPAKSSLTIGGEDIYLYEPLALEYLAAAVKDHHDVRIVDLRLGEDLQQTLESFQPDIVGVTAYTVHVNSVRRLLQQVKKWNPQTLTVIGGHHATVVPEDFHNAAIDVIVIGEGVFAFREIVNCFEQGKSFAAVPGIAFADGDKLIKTEAVPFGELDALPLPDRTFTAQYRKFYYSEWMKPLASIRTSKGCPFRCNFCALWKLTGGRYLKRDPEKIVEELASIQEKNVFFADDESLVDVKRMTTLAERIKSAGLNQQYFLYGRSDTIARNPELLALWREAGLTRVFVGLEFCRDEDLAYINKGSSTKDNDEAIRILNDLGIDIYASFILRPEFTEEDFRALADYRRRLELPFASFAVLTPLPGTDLYEQVRDRLITNNYDYFDFIHTVLPTTLPLKEFYQRYVWLLDGAVPLRTRLSLLNKFPIKEFPAIISKTRKIFRSMRMAYQDYE